MDKAANEIRLREWASIVQAANNSGMQKKDWCSQNTTAVSFFPELMLQFGKYQIMVGTGVKALTLSTVLNVIGHV